MDMAQLASEKGPAPRPATAMTDPMTTTTEPATKDTSVKPPERRGPVIALVVALLVALVATDRLKPETVPERRDPDEVSAGAPGADAAGSTWYCPGGSTSPDGEADLTVVIANTGPDPVSGVAITTAFAPGSPDPPAPARENFELSGYTRLVLSPGEFVQAPHVAVTVEVDHGGVLVEQGVASSTGFDLAACAGSGSETWYFADGATTRNSSMLLHLYNPFPADAIVDLAFAATEGRAEPADLQGVVVPARALVAVNVGDHVRREAAVSASIVARSGRIVAGKIVRRNEPGQRGIVAGLGATEPAGTWRFPEGTVGGGVVERFHLYNPNEREARVDVEMVLDDGVVEPLEIPVPGQGRVTLTVNGEGETGLVIPEGVGHSAVFRVLNEVDVIVERGLEGTGRHSGLGASLGAPIAARQWGMAAGVATPAVEEWIVVQNASEREALVRVEAISEGSNVELDRLGGLTIPPSGRRGFRLNDLLGQPGSSTETLEAALLVSSDQPIVVERTMFRIGRSGLSTTMATPFSEDVADSE